MQCVGGLTMLLVYASVFAQSIGQKHAALAGAQLALLTESAEAASKQGRVFRAAVEEVEGEAFRGKALDCPEFLLKLLQHRGEVLATAALPLEAYSDVLAAVAARLREARRRLADAAAAARCAGALPAALVLLCCALSLYAVLHVEGCVGRAPPPYRRLVGMAAVAPLAYWLMCVVAGTLARSLAVGSFCRHVDRNSLLVARHLLEAPV